MTADDLVRTADPAEVERLTARGYEVVRKRFLLVADVDDVPAPMRAPAEGITVGPLPPEPESLIDMHWLSYPPEHPDHVPEETDPAVAQAFFTDLFDGRVVGPWMPEASFVARRQDRVVGAVIVNAFDDDTDGLYTGPWVSDLQVRPDEQRHGLGRLLLTHAMCAVAARGHPRIGLAVTKGIDAERLYRQLGFDDLAPPMWQLRPPLSSA